MSSVRTLVLVLSVVLVLPVASAVVGETKGGDGEWWVVPYPEPFDASGIETSLQFIQVEGNRFVDEEGNTRVFQGVNISDPDKLEKNGQWSKAHLEVIKDWAYELHNVGRDPIEFEGIGYATHPYPMKALQPWEENWEKDFGYVADTYPVMAAEIEFMAAKDPGAHIPVIADEDYGRRILAYFEKKGISWTVWNFDADWPPQMISDWDYNPTTQGAFFKDYMLEKR